MESLLRSEVSGSVASVNIFTKEALLFDSVASPSFSLDHDTVHH